MSNINKQVMDIDLSRFNRSGSVYSPISKIGSATSVSKRLQPTQTSTPLTRNLPWQKNSSTPVKAMTYQNSTIHRSPRYSLSSVSSTPKIQNSASTSAIQTVAGPLLASTRFNINLGTYTDTKSPGLAGRVVQYHNEAQTNQSQTHQAKYGSPGQFPIVQLYKKELPLLTRIPRRCTVRIAPPDSVAYNAAEANTILRETFVQPNAERTTTEDTEINTKSVLDALKEISRKRIHTNDDIDDITKRQRKDSICTVSTSSDNTNKDGKRLREDTPPKPKGTPLSPGTNIPKKICVTNEIECSLSSSVLMRFQGQKRKAAVGSLANVNKQRRIGSDEDLVSKETQTNMETSNTVPVTHSTQTNFTESVNGESADGESAPEEKQTSEPQTEDKDYKGLQTILQNARRKKKEYHEKSVKEIDAERASIRFDEPTIYKPLFNPEPLEIIRKNRVEMAMAAFNGEKPEITPLPHLTLTQMKENYLNQTRQQQEAKSLPSILSPKNKTKHDKHVTFDIPNTNGNNNNEATTTETNNGDNNNTDSSSLKINFGTVNSSAISTFNNSPSLTSINETVKSSSFAVPTVNLTPSTKTPTLVPTPQNSPISFASSTNQATFSTNNFNFTSSDATKSPFSASDTTPKTSPPAFGAITTTTVSNNTIATPGVNDTIQPSSSVNFGSTQNTITFGGFGGSNLMKSPAFGGLAPSAAVASPNNTSTTSSANGAMALDTTTSNISFGFPANNNGASAPVPVSVPAPVSAAAPVSAPALPFNSTPANSVPPPPFPQTSLVSTVATTQPNLSFGSSQPVIGFGSNIQTTTTSATGSITFGTPVQTTQSTVAFGTPTTSATAGVFGFGAKTETSQPTTTQGFAFGGSKPTSSSPKTGGFKFDLGKLAAPYTIATTITDTQNKSSVFGDTNMNKPSTFAFGSTNNNNISTTTAAASVFGTPTATTSVFGAGTAAPPAFGTPKTTENPPAFGTFGTVSTCQSSSFGSFNTPTTAQNTPGFGGFGTTPKTNNNFATPTTTNNFNFGNNNNNTTNKPFAFNAATTTTNTNAPNVFGTPSSTFGNPAPTGSVFGAPTTTAAIVPSGSGVFGTPSTTASTSNVFGPPTTTSGVFGPNTATTTANTFGQQSGGVFGGTASGFGNAQTNGSTFGTPNNTFASTGAPNAFGAPPNQSPFGTGTTQGGVFSGNNNNQTNAFASPNNNRPPAFGSTGATGTFGGFGASNTSQPTATAGFGTNTTQQTATVGFGTSSAQPTATGGFGTSTAQPTATSGFGTNTAQPTVTGGFGTGSTQPTASGVFGTPAGQSTAAGGFGAASSQTSATGGFGTTNAQPAAAGFGGFGATTSQTPAQQTGIFAFGNTAQNATPAAQSNAFQFGGQTTPAKSAGFNFSGGSSTPNMNFSAGASTPAPGFGAASPPGFGTSNTGMFSIGSGSTLPKQRPIIKARRRNN